MKQSSGLLGVYIVVDRDNKLYSKTVIYQVQLYKKNIVR